MATGAEEHSLSDVLTQFVHTQTTTLWDPNLSNDWDKEKATEQCILRIKRWIFVLPVHPKPFTP